MPPAPAYKDEGVRREILIGEESLSLARSEAKPRYVTAFIEKTLAGMKEP
ncbi:MAG: hypothetical protein M3463_13960 [Verrucomicrobiota bacterium]|nr:hypothetical protein [Verrucomicrobiota bacterium]